MLTRSLLTRLPRIVHGFGTRIATVGHECEDAGEAI
jgi:hypothetical protein